VERARCRRPAAAFRPKQFESSDPSVSVSLFMTHQMPSLDATKLNKFDSLSQFTQRGESGFGSKNSSLRDDHFSGLNQRCSFCYFQYFDSL
jgi:hypothetical protein